MNFSAVILAGGKSSRMGCDKALMEIGGQTLLARQIQLVSEAGADEVFISGRADADYSAFGCPVLKDKFPDAGPLAGIERALDAATSPLLLVVAVDLVALELKTLQMLAARCAENCGAVPRVEGNIEPLAAFYPKAALPLATFLLNQNSFAVKNFVNRCEQGALVSTVDLPADAAGPFRNCNSPGELESARSNQAV